jgi:hypothetical protein
LGDVVGISASYDFVAPLTFGLVVLGGYSTWFRMAAKRQPERWATTVVIGEAITAALCAVVFWWGAGFVLLNGLESIGGRSVGQLNWASAIALVITGISYIPLDLYLLRRSTQDPALASASRRGLVFALLGAGILDGAVGAAVALYALGTSLLGSPLNDWPHLARIGVSAFVVGAIIVGLYLWRATREHLFSGLAKHTVPAVGTTTLAAAGASVPRTEPITKPSTIEGILDELVAGKITRDAAAAQIRAMMIPQPLSL